MVRDDYHVIVYQILAYLYQCLKSGTPVEGKNIENNSKYFQLNDPPKIVYRSTQLAIMVLN